jgi:hypothetical protein
MPRPATPTRPRLELLEDRLAPATLTVNSNIDVNYTGTIHFTTSDSDPGVVLPAEYTFQAGDAGRVTFSAGVTLITAGDQTLTVTDVDSSITGSTIVTL